MARETRILLALLGLLAGVFLGVVSMKLFVPRPPAGTGPDINLPGASGEIALVPPPDLDAAAVIADTAAAVPAADTTPAAAGSRFGRETDPPRQDPFLTPASFTQPEPLQAPPPEAPPLEPAPLDAAPIPAPESPAPAHGDHGPLPPASAGDASGPPPPDGDPVPAAGLEVAAAATTYVVVAGDSWWGVAERAYGDGRLYRALFAWNRGLDPRIALVPGTRLELPPLDRLAAAWPGLVPGP